MAFQLLQRDRSGGMRPAQALTRAMSEIGHCADCRTFTEQDVCTICANPRRQQNGQICVVESPADIHAIEQTGQFAGRYFVLMGHLSPLDGIGPGDIGLDRTGNGWKGKHHRSDPRYQPDGGRGSDRQLHRRDAASMACSPTVSPMACRWAASWKWSTAPRCRIRWPGVTPSSSDVFPDGAIRPCLFLPKISRRPLEKQDPDPHLILIVRFW